MSVISNKTNRQLPKRHDESVPEDNPVPTAPGSSIGLGTAKRSPYDVPLPKASGVKRNDVQRKWANPLWEH